MTMTIIPFDDRDGTIWYNGEFIPWRDAKIHVLNHGLHYGSCVFEGERAYGGKIFKLQEHTERLHESARLLGFDIPYSVKELMDATIGIIHQQSIQDGYIRPFAWRGSERMSIGAPHNKIHVAIAAWPWPNYYSAESKQQGLRLLFAPWTRPSPQSAPTASKAAGLYMICTLSKHHAEQQGYHDALMLDYRGYIAEGTSANFFMVTHDGHLHTPIADCFLNGITRLTVIELAKELGIPCHERYILPEELTHSREAFLTGTATEITPIASIAEHRYLTPGPITATLMQAYHDRARGL
jgi:branched-chain amino acid aminotransferase